MFLLTNDHIPAGVGFQAFGLTHLLWLLAGLTLWVCACFFFRKLAAGRQNTVLRVLGIYILAYCREAVERLDSIHDCLIERIPLHYALKVSRLILIKEISASCSIRLSDEKIYIISFVYRQTGTWGYRVALCSRGHR